jgi:hypothetical protein
MSERNKQLRGRRPWRGARRGRDDSGQARPAGWWTQADIDYARDFLARQRAATPTPPGGLRPPPSPEGEGKEKSSLHDSPAQDAPPAFPAPVERTVERPIERPWIPAAVRAQMPVIDPMFTVKRVKEDGAPVDPHHGYRWI